VKIIRQTTEELVLQEGSTSGLIVGGALAVAGIAAAVVFASKGIIALGIAAALVVVGAVIVLFASSITVSANRRNGQMVYEKKRIAGAQTKAYSIADVFRIETRKQWRVNNSGPNDNQAAATPQMQLVAQSVIVFKNGSELPLDHEKVSSTTQVGSMVLTGGQANETATAAQVAQFLNVPFQEIMPPNMGSGINIQF
jgi:hypothetical protein